MITRAYEPVALAELSAEEREVFLRSVIASRTWTGSYDRARRAGLAVRMAFWELEEARRGS